MPSSALHPWGGRSAPPPRVTFSPMRKSPKNLPEGISPLETPLGGPSEKCFTFRSRSPCGEPHPLDRVSDTTKDRFATLGLWANRSCFFLWFLRGDISCCQSVARQVSCPEDAAGLFCPQPKPLGQRAGGSKGAEVKAERFYFRPLRRRSRDQEVPGESLVTFFSQESHPGRGAERPHNGCRDYRPAKTPRGRGAKPLGKL